MKPFYFFTTIVASILIMLSTSHRMKAQGNSLRVMTYNIRYDNPDDAPNNWDNRKNKVANLIQYYRPIFLGTQEALFHQLDYLDKQLSDYHWIGKGREDGKKGGEFSALLYDTREVELAAQSDSTIWLSQTPEKPSKSWDAALPRILTWGKFQVKKTGQTIYAFNTHFDHIGEKARQESAKIIIATIKKIAGDAPVVLTGDFNITEESIPYQILSSSFLKDSYYASKTAPVGPEFTFSGFKVAEISEHRRIDYIFVNPPVTVTHTAIISSFNDGYYPSDHLPVIADIMIK